MMLMVTLLVVGCASATERPIIGILSQEPSEEIRMHYPSATAFISASYVKAVEAAGARAVPIHINRTTQYYKDIVSAVNGLVFPGGSASFEAPGGYAAAGRQIMRFVKQLQNDGVWIPVLGVCLGMQFLVYLDSNSSSESPILVPCNAINEGIPLNFTQGVSQSRLYRLAGEDILDILRTLPVTSNHHKYCVTEKGMKAHNLDLTWNVLSTNQDLQGLKFISSMERKTEPIAGVQFHPEKNMYEWNPQQVNPHSRKAILANRLFYDWLVDESRANNQSFPDERSERSALIYNYGPEYTGGWGGYNQQSYVFFPPHTHTTHPQHDASKVNVVLL